MRHLFEKRPRLLCLGRVEGGGLAGIRKDQCPNKLGQVDPGGWGWQTEAQTGGGMPSSFNGPKECFDGRGLDLRALTRFTLWADFLRTNRRQVTGGANICKSRNADATLKDNRSKTGEARPVLEPVGVGFLD